MTEPRSDPFLGLADRMDTDRDSELVRIAVRNARLAQPAPLDGLREALVEAVMPLEVIAAQDLAKPYVELSRDFIEVIGAAIARVRAALRAEGRDTP